MSQPRLTEEVSKVYSPTDSYFASCTRYLGRKKILQGATPLLMASLHAGCIPIILIDNLVLPFSEVLDWKRFSIRFYEHDSELIYDHVMSQVTKESNF